MTLKIERILLLSTYYYHNLLLLSTYAFCSHDVWPVANAYKFSLLLNLLLLSPYFTRYILQVKSFSYSLKYYLTTYYCCRNFLLPALNCHYFFTKATIFSLNIIQTSLKIILEKFQAGLMCSCCKYAATYVYILFSF